MKMAFTIATREFKSLFLSPLAWTLLAILQLILAYLFLTQVETFNMLQPKLARLDNAPGLTDIVVTPLFGNAGIIFLLATPLLTMRLITEERRNKTLALLLSAPISNTEIVVGKYFGVVGLLFVMVVLTALMPLSLLVGGDLDLGKLAANLLALTLLAAAFAATGVYTSCIASHPTIAAMSAFGLLLLLWILDWTAGMGEQRAYVFEYLSILRHFQNLQSGLISTADIGYFLLFIAIFLVLGIRRLDYDRLQK
jgi:ABC-2 type transport system permease protein